MEREIKIYTTDDCAACKMLKRLLKDKRSFDDVTFININANPESKPKNMNSAPYVVINDEHLKNSFELLNIL